MPSTIVLGTPLTRYLRERSKNSVASTDAAVMWGFSNASLCARTTAPGQCGHVGVTNTSIVIGWSTCATSALLSSLSPESSPPARMIASMSDMNS